MNMMNDKEKLSEVTQLRSWFNAYFSLGILSFHLSTWWRGLIKNELEARIYKDPIKSWQLLQYGNICHSNGTLSD